MPWWTATLEVITLAQTAVFGSEVMHFAAIISVVVLCAVARGEDLRLREWRDLDHPAEFVPQFVDREQWEKRAREVREQILVSMGLWPMPEKGALAPVIHGRIER